MAATDLTRFNNQISNLVKDLKSLECFKDDKFLTVFEFKFDTAKTMNANLPLTYFLKYVYPHKVHIMSENETFFIGQLTDDYVKSSDISKDVGESNEFILHKALNIKAYWENDLTDEEKKTIWTYFKVLIKLTERYLAKRINN